MVALRVDGSAHGDAICSEGAYRGADEELVSWEGGGGKGQGARAGGFTPLSRGALASSKVRHPPAYAHTA